MEIKFYSTAEICMELGPKQCDLAGWWIFDYDVPEAWGPFDSHDECIAFLGGEPGDDHILTPDYGYGKEHA